MIWMNGKLEPLDGRGTLLEPQICTRSDYHDGPCNGFQNERCKLKQEFIIKGKLMSETKLSKNMENAVVAWKTFLCVRRGWIRAAWAWIKGAP